MRCGKVGGESGELRAKSRRRRESGDREMKKRRKEAGEFSDGVGWDQDVRTEVPTEDTEYAEESAEKRQRPANHADKRE